MNDDGRLDGHDRAEGFAGWYARQRPELVRTLGGVLGDPVLAAEAADEALVRAFERWDHVSAMASPGGWAYRVAVNAARRSLRRAGIERDRVARLRPEPVPPPAGETWLAVADLPPRQRTVVALRHLGGLREREIAEVLGISRSTVSSTLIAARAALARVLEDPEEDDTMDDELRLGIARACDETGCRVEFLDGGAEQARWGERVAGTVKVRPGDLVAVGCGSGAEVVWRWWHGSVLEAADEVVTAERNVTRREADAPRTATFEVHLPPGLAGAVGAGDTVFWTRDDDRLVAVASGRRPQPPEPQLARVREAYRNAT